MPIVKPVAEFKIPTLLLALFLATRLALPAQAATRFHLEKDAHGSVKPFKAIEVALPDFVREYSRLTSTPITVGGTWTPELKGSVTLLIRRPLKPDELTEIFHRVLNDNGYAVVDAPAGNGWIVQRSRDARDAALPVYESAAVPDSSRLVTAFMPLKYADAEDVARTIRSFMPANSRIIPATRSQVFITDTGSNIRKLTAIISQMDTEAVARKNRESANFHTSVPSRACGEQRIEKLVIEKMEIQDSGANLKMKPLIAEGKK